MLAYFSAISASQISACNNSASYKQTIELPAKIGGRNSCSHDFFFKVICSQSLENWEISSDQKA